MRQFSKKRTIKRRRLGYKRQRKWNDYRIVTYIFINSINFNSKAPEWNGKVLSLFENTSTKKRKNDDKKENDNGSDVNMLSERKHNVYYITKELR